MNQAKELVITEIRLDTVGKLYIMGKGGEVRWIAAAYFRERGFRDQVLCEGRYQDRDIGCWLVRIFHDERMPASQQHYSPIPGVSPAMAEQLLRSWLNSRRPTEVLGVKLPATMAVGEVTETEGG